MTLIDHIKAVGAILKPLSEFIEIVEEKLGSNTGPQKFVAVMEFAKSLLGALGDLPAVTAIVTAFINGIVAAFNKAGIFKKAAPNA